MKLLVMLMPNLESHYPQCTKVLKCDNKNPGIFTINDVPYVNIETSRKWKDRIMKTVF